MAKVLLIDDNQGMCVILSSAITQEGHDVVCAHTLSDGLKEGLSRSYDVVFLDVMLPDGNGLDLLPKLRETPSKPEVIIITSGGDAEGAKLAIKNGAWDYIKKPSPIKAMLFPFLRALQYREEKKSQKQPLALKREGIIGTNPQIIACLDMVAQAAGSQANVLINGETGTGKELFARAIHINSPRADRSFVVVDCGALPQTLIESLLFGHEKGAFTGADRATSGLISQADGGTLFLDEVGEMPLSIQKTFLRVLQERRFRPVGGKQERESDFRLVAATNRDLNDLVSKGRFRKDLLYRLNSIIIDLPPLREHRDDIIPLARHFLAKSCDTRGQETKGLSPEFLQMLREYDWPGNIRELENCLEETLIKTQEDPILFPMHLPDQIRIKSASAHLSPQRKTLPENTEEQRAGKKGQLGTFQDLREKTLTEMELTYFQNLMETTKGSIKEACRISGLSRNRLYIYLKRHNISRFGWH